jgi:hypothetical protein
LSLNHRGGKRRSEKRNYSDSRAVRQLFFSDFLHCRVETFTFGYDCTLLEPRILAFCFTFGYTFARKERDVFLQTANEAVCRVRFVVVAHRVRSYKGAHTYVGLRTRMKKAAQGRLFHSCR